MKWVQPKVYLIAATTRLDSNGRNSNTDFQDYLSAIGAHVDWEAEGETDAEELIEIGGRLCYRSFGTDLNLNITRVRKDNLAYLQNIIKVGHGSVLEHSSVTFIFHNVSRVFTHELVRHRVGDAFSQESLRYVALDDIPFVSPLEMLAEVTNDETDAKQFMVDLEALILSSETFIEIWRNKLIGSDARMSHKKKVTSLLRRAAPIGLATSIMWTANFRTIRHVLELRTSKGAEAEIRHVFNLVGERMKKEYPAVFDDFTCDDGVWTCGRSKV